MEDILVDKEIGIKEKRPVFSQVAFFIAMLTVLIFIIMVITYLTKATKKWEMQVVLLTRGIILTVILGFGFSITALLKKEKLRYLKFIGTLINFIFFVFFMAAVISVFVDWKKTAH